MAHLGHIRNSVSQRQDAGSWIAGRASIFESGYVGKANDHRWRRTERRRVRELSLGRARGCVVAAHK